MYFIPALFLAVSSVFSAVKPTFKQDKNLLKTINANFRSAAEQYTYLASLRPDSRFPKTYNPATGKAEWSDSGWWCSGFYPGTLLFLYQETKDAALLTESNRILKTLEKEQFNTSTHDLGFMMYCSFGNHLNIAPSPADRQILINSAKSLITRFDPAVGCIKSWDSDKPEYLVIIDNMMNLELLFWATRATGDSTYYKIAVTHANTTIKNHFRPDYSSYHVINYHPQTGAVQEKRTAQGYSDESAWARGQAWGLYGFTVMYRETHDRLYLDQARHIASFLLNHPNLPEDKVPYWDFNAPDIPNAPRDASAAAIMASALLELCKYTSEKEGNTCFKGAEQMLKSLASPAYYAAPKANGGFLIMHGVGNKPKGTEVDVPLTYADYYFVEAMRRYKDINEG
jgi:hypothetical protein